MFVVGLEKMNTGEKVALLAQLNAFSGSNVLNEAIRKKGKEATAALLKYAKVFTKTLSTDTARRIEKLDNQLEWNTEVLKQAIEEEMNRLSRLSPGEVNRQLQNRLRKIAGVDINADLEVTARAILCRAARSLKIKDLQYKDDASLEEEVFEEAIREIIDQLKRQLNRMSQAERNRLERYLQEEIDRLSKADLDAIKKAMGLEEVSGKALMTFLRSASSFVIAQLIVAGTGFGAYLFLTSVINAFSLLLGVTFSFGVYTAATSTLAFLLSGPFLFIMIVVAGGFVYRNVNSVISNQLAKILVVVGKSQTILSKNESRPGPEPRCQLP